MPDGRKSLDRYCRTEHNMRSHFRFGGRAAATMTKITYQNKRTGEEADRSLTLLQMSLKHAIPHVHACGGNARCSTCRVMVHAGLANVLPRNEAEQALA